MVFNTSYRLMQVKSMGHSAILSTFIKLQFVIKTFALSIFQWPFTQVFLYIFYSCLTHVPVFYVREGERLYTEILM